MDHNEDIDKEIRISLSILCDIVIQVGNEVMRYLSNSFIYGCNILAIYIYIYIYIQPVFYSRNYLIAG